MYARGAAMRLERLEGGAASYPNRQDEQRETAIDSEAPHGKMSGICEDKGRPARFMTSSRGCRNMQG